MLSASSNSFLMIIKVLRLAHNTAHNTRHLHLQYKCSYTRTISPERLDFWELMDDMCGSLMIRYFGRLPSILPRQNVKWPGNETGILLWCT